MTWIGSGGFVQVSLMVFSAVGFGGFIAGRTIGCGGFGGFIGHPLHI